MLPAWTRSVTSWAAVDPAVDAALLACAEPVLSGGHGPSMATRGRAPVHADCDVTARLRTRGGGDLAVV